MMLGIPGRVKRPRSSLSLLPFVAVIFMAMAILLWNRGVNNYSSTGT